MTKELANERAEELQAVKEQMLAEEREQLEAEDRSAEDHGEWLDKAHVYKVSNYRVVALAYSVRDLLTPLIESRERLFCEEANGYLSIFLLVREMLKNVDEKHLDRGAKAFFAKDLSNDWDRLSFEDEEPAEKEKVEDEILS